MTASGNGPQITADAAAGWRIRPACPWDTAALARVYRDSIRTLGAGCYSAAQLAAWSALGDDAAAFRAWAAGTSNRLAVDASGRCLGFAGLQPPGRIASLFVAPCSARRGIATALVTALLQDPALQGPCDVALRVEASALARPLFERLGFTVVAEEQVRVRGVTFSRHLMRLQRDC